MLYDAPSAARTVLVRDRSALFADALAWSLTGAGFAATVSDVTAPIDSSASLAECHLVVLDGDRPPAQVLADAAAVPRNGDRPSLLLLVRQRDDDRLRLADRIGADACISRDCDLTAIIATLTRLARPNGIPRQRGTFRRARRGRPAPSGLTTREIDVLHLVADGHGNDAIAATLGISPNTVRTHLQNILAKLGVHSRFAAVGAARRAGLLGGHPYEAALGSG